jgi:tetratricopeptide (TPR) repeat protein
MNYARLAKTLVTEGKNEKAIAVLDYCMETLPVKKLSYDPYMADVVEAYFAAGGTEKALAIGNAMADFYYEHLDYYLKQNQYIIHSAEFEIQTAIQYTSRIANAFRANGKPELAEEINKTLEGYYTSFVRTIQPELN